MCRAMPHPAWDDVFAHVSHAFIPGARSLRELSVRRVQSRGFPSAAVSWRSACGISPRKYGSPADCLCFRADILVV